MEDLCHVSLCFKQFQFVFYGFWHLLTHFRGHKPKHPSTIFWCIFRKAGELINFGADAINNTTTIFDMLQFVFPAVSWHLYGFVLEWFTSEKVLTTPSFKCGLKTNHDC